MPEVRKTSRHEGAGLADDAHRLRASILAGERTVSEVLEESLERIASLDERLGCFLVVDAEGARARARQLEREREEGAMPGALFETPGFFRLCLTATDEMCERALPGLAAALRQTEALHH